MVAIIAQIVVLSPKPLDQPATSPSKPIHPTDLITSDEAVLAPGIPKDRIADYTLDGFRYSSSEGVQKQWHLVADRAFMYNEEKLVHAVRIVANLYDTDGKITLVTGKEAKYYLNDRDVEIFGDVVATFPDGFTIESQYMRHYGGPKTIEIPEKYLVRGESKADKNSEHVAFTSQGLNYSMQDQRAQLLQTVHLTLTSRQKIKNNRTTVESDHALIERKDRIAYFTMDPKRPPENRFVHINEPTLFARSRKAEMNYGEAGKIVSYLIAQEDVFLRDRETKPSFRYATGGRAEFDNRKNVVRLTGFPQVYENNDTMTGEVIILHRDSDVVEVEHSNAYSEGGE